MRDIAKTVLGSFLVGLCASMCCVGSVQALDSQDLAIMTRLWDASSTTLLEMHPLQAPQKQFQAPAKMELQAPSKFDQLQAPSKFAAIQAPLRANRVKFCSVIPGRANRLARRAERLTAAMEAKESRQLLEVTTMTEMDRLNPGYSRTLLEGSCSSCNVVSAPAVSSPIVLTSLTTRELLEGGSIARQVRTVNEPGVCGSGQCSGGGRFRLFRR